MSRDRIVVHIDPHTHELLNTISLHNDLYESAKIILIYYIHPAPITLLEGFFNRHDPSFIDYVMHQPATTEGVIFLHMDVDTIFQKPLRTIGWPAYEPNQLFVSLETTNIYGPCHIGAFLQSCGMLDEISYHDTTLKEFMSNAPGFTAGTFGFTDGDGVKTVFRELAILKHNSNNPNVYYEQGCVNYVITKHHIIGGITMNISPLSLRDVIGDNENKGEALISLKGNAGQGIFHLDKVLGYLFTRSGPFTGV